MPRGDWLGIETHGAEDNVPAVSPRHRDRNNPIDHAISELTPRLVRKASGHVVELQAHMMLKPGDVVLEPFGIDTPIEIAPGVTMTRRDQLLADIGRAAREVLPWARYTGRVKRDGREVFHETTDDHNVPVGHEHRLIDQVIKK